MNRLHAPRRGPITTTAALLLTPLFALAMAGGAVAAQAYPSRAVKIVVPFGPGGANDTVARFLAKGLGEKWQQAVVVENRTGAGSQVGSAYVANAKADGYTLLFDSPAYTTLPAVRRSLPYDPLTDFKPVAMVGRAKFLFGVGPRVKATTLRGFINEAKSRQVFFASPGTGTAVNLAAELFNQAAGIDMKMVQYKGGAESLLDVAAGRADAYIGTISTFLPFISGNKVRLLAVLDNERIPSYANVPTAAQEGLTGANSSSWWGIFAPAKTPDDIVQKLNSDIRAVMSSADAKQFLSKEQAANSSLSAAQFKSYVDGELGRWKQLVLKRNISVH